MRKPNCQNNVCRAININECFRAIISISHELNKDSNVTSCCQRQRRRSGVIDVTDRTRSNCCKQKKDTSLRSSFIKIFKVSFGAALRGLVDVKS